MHVYLKEDDHLDSRFQGLGSIHYQSLFPACKTEFLKPNKGALFLLHWLS